MPDVELIKDKINDVEKEMQKTGLWRQHIPQWVGHYQQNAIITKADFCDWLQFIYLPNLVQQVKTPDGIYHEHYIAPQAIRFFGEDVQRGKLLQLLVELDSLS